VCSGANDDTISLLACNFVCEDCIIVFERAVIRLAISESLKGLLLCGAPETIVLCKGFLAAECMTVGGGGRRGGAVLLIQLVENCDGIGLHPAHRTVPSHAQRSQHQLLFL